MVQPRWNLMVNALGSKGEGLSPCRGHCCVLGHDTLLPRCLSPPRCIYKWVPAKLMLGGNPAMDWHPIQGE